MERVINLDYLIKDMKKIGSFIGKDGTSLELSKEEKEVLFDYFNDLYKFWVENICDIVCIY